MPGRKSSIPRSVFHLEVMTLPFLLCSRSAALLLHQAPRDSQCSPAASQIPLLVCCQTPVLLQTSLLLHSCTCAEQEHSTSITIPRHSHNITVAYRSDQLFNCPPVQHRQIGISTAQQTKRQQLNQEDNYT